MIAICLNNRSRSNIRGDCGNSSIIRHASGSSGAETWRQRRGCLLLLGLGVLGGLGARFRVSGWPPQRSSRGHPQLCWWSVHLHPPCTRMSGCSCDLCRSAIDFRCLGEAASTRVVSESFREAGRLPITRHSRWPKACPLSNISSR